MVTPDKRLIDLWGWELMVPYAELSEEAKELDRASVRAVYAAIAAAEE